MKYAIFGDIHANLEAFDAVLEHAEQQGCTEHVCTGDIVGYANSGALRPKAAYDTSVEVSIYRAPGYREPGLGTLLYQALFDRLSEEDVHRAHAVITLPNDASVALHKKMGFYDVGVLNEAGRKFGRFHSVLWMEKKLS
jgi:phosphinothricin acetyltransferase